MGIFPETHPERPVQKFGSLNFPRPRSQLSLLVVLCLGLGYVGSFFAAWNLYFPSRLECLLWRIVVSVQCVITFLAGSFEIYYFATPTEPHRALILTASNRSKHDTEAALAEIRTMTESSPTQQSVLQKFWNQPCNNTIGRHPLLNIPLRSLILTTPLCATYVLCRWYLLIEDIIGIRSLPESAYQEVDWTRYWPSF